MPRPIVTALALLALAACTEPDSDTPPDAGVTPPLDAAAGQVWIRGAQIDGAAGQIVLAFVTPAGGGPARGAVCAPVTGDGFAFVAAVRTPAASNPCELGAEVVFSDGAYDVTAGIYTPGTQTPERCAAATVVVAGSGDVTLPAFGPCP